MLRRFLFLSVGALALLLVLGAPGQLHAQRMRGGFPHGVHPRFQGGFRPRIHAGFDRRFHRGLDRFEDRFENRFGFGRFDRFEDALERRFDARFHPGFFEPRFHHGPGPVRLFDPRFNPGFRPGFFLPF